MRVYTITNFTGHYPVGVSAVVFAKNEGEAAIVLMSELKRIEAPPQKPSEWRFDDTGYKTNCKKPEAIILQDGNY